MVGESLDGFFDALWAKVAQKTYSEAVFGAM